MKSAVLSLHATGKFHTAAKRSSALTSGSWGWAFIGSQKKMRKSSLFSAINAPNWGASFDLSKGSFLGALNDAFDQRELDLVMRLATDRDKANLYARVAQRSFVDCIVINSPLVDDPRIEALLQTGAKFVVHGRDHVHEKYPYYDIDNFGAFKQAAEYLIDLGHTEFAVFSHNQNLAYAKARLDGVKSAINESGVDCGLTVYEDHINTHFCYTIAKEALSSVAKPTAIICLDGVPQAMGTYRAARELGLKIGSDLSVIAHDDVIKRWDATKFDPPITVTKRPVIDACERLVDAAEGLIDGKEISELQFIDPVELVVRGSTGKVC